MENEQPYTEQEKEQISRLKRDLHRANLRNASMAAQIKMTEDQRDSWFPWWFRQSLFKFLRRHFPLTRKFLKQFRYEDYLSSDTLRQMHEARREDRQRVFEQNRAVGKNRKGNPLPNAPYPSKS